MNAALRTAEAVDTSGVDHAAGSSQTVRAQVRLRELIVGGELLPGMRIPELSLVERLGVSRTPVRAALLRLQEEGLLEGLPGGGFAVREFSETDIYDAIEVRGTLEGLAARLAAERGAPAVVLAEAKDCLERIDDLLAQAAFGDEAIAAYTLHNGRFHQLLAALSGSDVIVRQIERATSLPFASPNVVGGAGVRARDSFVIAQGQHRAAIEAIEQREGARAESVMREHARIARDNLRVAMASHQGLQAVPGQALIRRSPRRAAGRR
jgi:GntR family transcriptional regulator, vanillate catabolism transcriptional regulator